MVYTTTVGKTRVKSRTFRVYSERGYAHCVLTFFLSLLKRIKFKQRKHDGDGVWISDLN